MKTIGSTFGFTNGIITILSLLFGLYATKVSKIGIIGAILALLITDPLSDAYSMYISQKHTSTNAFRIGQEAFYSQMGIQFLFLCIIIFSKSLYQGVILCFITGISMVLLYDRYNKESIQNTVKHISVIGGLVILTYCIDTYVYKYFS